MVIIMAAMVWCSTTTPVCDWFQARADPNSCGEAGRMLTFCEGIWQLLFANIVKASNFGLWSCDFANFRTFAKSLMACWIAWNIGMSPRPPGLTLESYTIPLLKTTILILTIAWNYVMSRLSRCHGQCTYPSRTNPLALEFLHLLTFCGPTTFFLRAPIYTNVHNTITESIHSFALFKCLFKLKLGCPYCLV